ncbi:MAG: 2-oxoacid:acceptor oxidoreductase family protein [Planctomycetota bacterium]|jgi:indolepyruvate ferredoxin oxidoreductase beta subunit
MKAAARRLQLVICGLGGQGAVYLSRVLAEAAIEEGGEILTSETHGMAQRGGAVESHLKFGGFSGSVVRPGRADAVLVLDPSRREAGRRFLREGGACFVNTGEPAAGACDAFAIARKAGHPRGANLVLLGFAAATRPDLFPAAEAILAALERLSPPAVRRENRRAFESGRAAPETAGPDR